MPTSAHRSCAQLGMKCDRRSLLAGACCFLPVLTLGDHLRASQDKDKNPRNAMVATKDRIALALRRFRQGYHCSQSVLEAYARDFGIDLILAQRMAAALAGGSTVGGECGVVGSAYLVLGLKYAVPLPASGDVEMKDELWRRVHSFLAEFKKRHGAITCVELLGIDAFTREGRNEALRKNLFSTRCPNYIRSGIEILDSLD